MSDTDEQLKPGLKYKVMAIEKKSYIIVEGYKHPGGGIYWTEFVPSS
jgi:hypothetical protein